jgi:uncharacterized protein (DUF2236 family)
MVHEERVVGLFYGQRALCIGAVKPLNYVGTMEHTANRLSPFKRLIRTATIFETIFFGTKRQADKALAAVARMHEAVAGELSVEAGPRYPAGTPYAAHDPELMLWTLAVLTDSAEWFFERLVRPLTTVEREHFWLDSVRFGELFGMPRSCAPATHAEFREWYSQQLSGDDLHLSAHARHTGRMCVFAIPVPRSRRLGKALHDILLLGSLPPRVRELYELPWSSAHSAAFSSALTLMRLPRPLMPSALLRGSCHREYKMVASTERMRIARGQATPQLFS